MLAGIIQRGWLVYVLLVIMGLCLYKTMKGDPGYVPLHPDLTTAKKVGTTFVYNCVYTVLSRCLFPINCF